MSLPGGLRQTPRPFNPSPISGTDAAIEPGAVWGLASQATISRRFGESRVVELMWN
jgi:hypothetical protein